MYSYEKHLRYKSLIKLFTLTRPKYCLSTRSKTDPSGESWIKCKGSTILSNTKNKFIFMQKFTSIVVVLAATNDICMIRNPNTLNAKARFKTAGTQHCYRNSQMKPKARTVH
jgi:hypothetical protein